MSQLNIQRTNTTSDKSNNYNPYVQSKVDMRGIALLVGTIALVILVFWLFALFVAWLMCFRQYECYATSYVFYGGLGVIAVIIGIGIYAAFPILNEIVQNMRYRDFSGILLSREQIDVLAEKLLALGIEHNKSLATIGLEAKTDSHNNSSNTTTNTGAENTDDAAALAGLLELDPNDFKR